MLKKGLFVVKQDMHDAAYNEADVSEPIHYSEEGFVQSRINRGNLHALKININRIFQRYREKHAANIAEQEQKKEDNFRRIQLLIAENNSLDEQIAIIKTVNKEELHTQNAASRKIITEIRNKPEIIANGSYSRFSFWMGAFLLAGLSVFLFLFYTSASYAAFYKIFGVQNLRTTQVIFDPGAIASAFKEGITEALFVITMPFVFMAIGYLLHKMLEKRTILGMIRLGLFLLITIAFNAILGYQIAAKIHAASTIASYADYHPLTISAAGNDPVFWQVIFAGFTGYFLWGLVLDFFTDGLAKRNRIRTALKAEMKTIHANEIQLQAYDLETQAMAEERYANKEQIRKLESLNDIVIINPQEFEHRLYEYLSGWVEWMHYKRMPETDIQQAHHIAEEFLSNMKRRFEAIET
jgi:hypothetical protein